MDDYMSRTKHESIWNANVTGSGGSSDEIDQDNLEGPLTLNLAARSGGTNTGSIAVEHAHTSGGSFSAVPTDALFNKVTGEADSFDDISTSATDQTLGLDLSLCRRFIRITMSGSSLDQNVAASYAAIQQRSSTQ